jgi:hypothetical protein
MREEGVGWGRRLVGGEGGIRVEREKFGEKRS